MAETLPTGAALRPPIRVRVASSVRFRLTVTVVLVVGLSLLGGGTLLVKWVEATLLNDIRVRNERILESMAERIGGGNVPVEFLRPVDDVRAMSEETRGLFDSFEEAEEAISSTYFYMDGDVPDFLPGLRDGTFTFFQRQRAPSSVTGDTLEVTRDVVMPDGRVITLHAVSVTDGVGRSVGALSAALVVGLPLLVIGAGVMTWVITGRTLAPVGVMTRRVRELSATTLDARVPVPRSDDEIAQLARTMNEMLDRLQASSVSQRQFVSDASHELRSPVASIRAQLETALQYPDDVDWPGIARTVLAEDERLEHLVGNLLAMARLEEGRLGPRGEVDLDDIVMAQARRVTGATLDLSGVSAGRVWANADEMTSVVRNLVDNAVRHARERVTVTVREAGPWVVLSVADDGPGIAAEDRERVFERFARLQEGRSRDQGGTGLGLALSRRVVESHGGRVHVEDAPGGGARFVVSLPAAAWTGTEETDHGADSDEPTGAGPTGDTPDRGAADGVPAAGPASGVGQVEVRGAAVGQEPLEGRPG